MEDVNAQGTSSQPSIAPAPSDLPDSQVDPARPVPSSSSHENSQGNDGSQQRRIDQKSHVVDTAAPIDSVKGAVNKFGGKLDWREKRVQVPQDEIDKVQHEVTEYEKRSREAEAGRVLALQELESTASAADELRLRLETAQAEEAQARQETELAELRLREVQRGNTESAAAKAELDVLRDRRAAALADLQSARAELASLEKDRAAARARETAAASSQSQEAGGKAVEDDLAAELVALKGELESAHAAHGEAEEKTRRLAAAFEQDKSQWQSELEEAEQEAKRLREELMAACDLESKAEAASELLASLKAELSACTVEVETPRGEEDEEEKPTKALLEKTKKELDDVKESIEKAKHEANHLRVAAASMRDDLEREKAELAALQRKEKELSEELNRATSDLAAAEEARANKDAHDESNKMAEQVGEARREAEQAKARARSAREEVAKAREDASVAKAAVAAVEARLEAVTREILAANTSEEMATASANAVLQEKRKASRDREEEGVTLTTEEYDELSRRARETEEAAGKRVGEAVKLIKEAKDAEVRSLEKLAQVAKQTEQRRQALQAATEEAEEAEFAKLSAERELRQWRAEHEQQGPRTGLAEISVLDDPGGGNPHILSPRAGYMPMVAAGAAAAAEAEARQRKAFLPRMVMFLARKRAQSWNK